MAVQGTEPISAANLKAALESFAGGGLFRETLYAGTKANSLTIPTPTDYSKLVVEYSEGNMSPRYSVEIPPVNGSRVEISIKSKKSYLKLEHFAGDSLNDPYWMLRIENNNWLIARVVGYLKL